MATDQGTSTLAVSQAAAFDPVRYLEEVNPSSLIARCTHHGEPLAQVTNARPRSGTRVGRVCAGGTKLQHKQALASLVRPFVTTGTPFSDWAFGVRAIFYVQTHQRKDVDNMLKVVVDAMKKLVFEDDRQVKEMMGWSLFDGVRPRTEFTVYRLHPIDRESGTCVRCGKPFRLYASWKHRTHCSRACYSLASSRAVELDCTHCGRSFLRKPSGVSDSESGQHFCSRACKGKHSRRRENCDICGAKIERPNSWARPGQVRNFCSVECYRVAPAAPRSKLSPVRLTAIANKGWETRRKKAAT